MKKYFMFSMLAVAGLMSCGKDDDTKKGIDVTNPDALTDVASVYYGEKIKGALPAATAGGPELYASQQEVYTTGGRVAVIEPYATSGTIAGFYVQIEGAGSYFKVDYSKARGARKAPRPAVQGKEQEVPPVPTDSVIVIKLPKEVGAGEFCVKYAAYDAEGRVSAPVKACISVSDVAGLDGLAGTWKLSGTADSAGATWNRNVYAADSNFAQGWCYEGNLIVGDPGDQPKVDVFLGYNQLQQFEYTFNNDGTAKLIDKSKQKYLDLTTTTPCTDYNSYYKESNYDDSYNLVWSYNAKEKTITVFEVDEKGAIDYPETYKVTLKGNTLNFVGEGDWQEEYTRK